MVLILNSPRYPRQVLDAVDHGNCEAGLSAWARTAHCLPMRTGGKGKAFGPYRLARAELRGRA